jgi:hypothetical protein
MLVAQLAAAAASASISYVGAKNSAAAQEYQYKQAQRLAQENLQQQYAQMAVRQREEQIAKSQQVEQLSKEAYAAFGNIQTVAGESGVQGNTVNILMEEFRRQQAESIANVNLNYDFRRRQLAIEQLGLRGQAEGAMIRAYPTQGQPSILSPIFQVGGTALSSIGMYGSPTGMGKYWLGGSATGSGTGNPYLARAGEVG